MGDVNHSLMTREQLADRVEITLKDYIDLKITGLEHAIQTSKEDLERRLGDLNHLRQEVLRDRAMFVTRELHDRLQSDVSTLQTALGTLTSKVSTWLTAVAAFYGIIQIVLSAIFYHLFNSTK